MGKEEKRMVTDKFDQTMMKNLIRKATVCPAISNRGRERILSGISEFTQKKAVRRNPFTTVVYNPLLSFVFALPILVPLSVLVVFFLLRPVDHTFTSIVFVSGSAILENNKDRPLEAGNILGENETIHIPPDTVCDLSLGDKADFRLFPGSDFTAGSFSPLSPYRLVSLGKGSVYISKHGNLKQKKTLGIRINEYRFMLEGTRALLQNMGQKIRAFCFEGKVTVISDEGGKERKLFSLFSGERIEIMTEGKKRTYSINDFLEEPEILFDRALSNFPPFSPAVLEEHAVLLQTVHDREERLVEEEMELIRPDEPVPVEKGIDEKEPFLITKIGSVRDGSIGDGRINFITTAQDSGKGYILTRNNLFILDEGGVREAVRFTPSQIFRVKPVIAGNTIYCASTRNIYIIDMKSLTVKAEIPLPATGSAEDNYYPVLFNKTLYVPILNNGYYTVKTDVQKPGLKKLYDELFPVSPIVTFNEIIIGASYENYMAAIDERGTLLWKYPLGGKSYSNFIRRENNIFAYIFRNGKPMVISIDNRGKKHKEWLLEGPITADLTVYGGLIFGFYENGTLFRIDTSSGALENIDVLYEANLPSKVWRTIQPCIDGNILYSGTFRGELFIYNIESGKIESRVKVKEEEGIYTTPLLLNGDICLVTNSGTAYRVVKNDK
jgi:outer membrane protein assembly factor BamB